MLEEDYVTYDTAQLLKKAGFPKVECYDEWYVSKPYSTGVPWNSCDYKEGDVTCEYEKNHVIARPTLGLAAKWLRDNHKVNIEAFYDLDKSTWCGNINLMEEWENQDMIDTALKFDYPGKTYEETMEAGIRYWLLFLLSQKKSKK